MADSNNNFSVTNLDFNQIKQGLKDYLKSKPEYSDYDFDASGFSYLIDLLSYNTSNLAFFLNMVSSEMFLDSAILRESVSSKAKLLGYAPRSKTSAKAKLAVSWALTDPSPTPPILIPRSTTFRSRVDSATYVFQPITDTVVYPDAFGNYSLAELNVIEGNRLTYRFNIDNNNTEQRFILPNKGVDTNTILVKVQQSIYSSIVNSYSLATDITQLTSTSKVFYLQETGDGYYEIYFGDNVLSYKPETGNIVIVEYIISSGALANNVKQFEPTSGIGDFPSGSGNSISGYTIDVIQAALGGEDEETITDIKHYAPLSLEVQNRGVTKSDYEYILKRNYDFVDAVSVWGGENNVPPMYGSVFFAIKPKSGLVLDSREKELLQTDIIKNWAMLCQTPVIVDPMYTYLVIDSYVRYDYHSTIKTANEINADIFTTIQNYSDTVLSQFGSSFLFSKFVQQIDAVDASIISDMTRVRMKQRIFPTLGVKTQYEFNFNNTLDIYDSADFYNKPVRSTAFVYNGYDNCFLGAKDFASTTLSIFAVTSSGNKWLLDIGTIDYVNGIVSVNRFVPEAWIGDLNYIDLYAKPKAQDITPTREQIFLIEHEDVAVRVEAVR